MSFIEGNFLPFGPDSDHNTNPPHALMWRKEKTLTYKERAEENKQYLILNEERVPAGLHLCAEQPENLVS